MENLETTLTAIRALRNDKGVKAWLAPNEILFRESETHGDMFLTTYRIRNAYEELLSKLREGDEVIDERDILLIQRFFDMTFYPPRKMSLSAWKEGRDPKVRIVRAYKDRRWKGNRRRQHEITLLLDDGKTYQINPNDVLNKFLHIRENFVSLLGSNL
jgi:hypothetical protein